MATSMIDHQHDKYVVITQWDEWEQSVYPFRTRKEALAFYREQVSKHVGYLATLAKIQPVTA